MVVRDADVLAEASRHVGCHVYVSVPIVDETAWARLEPGTASPGPATARGASADRRRRRRGRADDAARAGHHDARARASSARCARLRRPARTFVGVNVAHLEDGVREHFFEFLAREYPHLLDGYRRLYVRGYAPKGYTNEITAIAKTTAARLGIEAR